MGFGNVHATFRLWFLNSLFFSFNSILHLYSWDAQRFLASQMKGDSLLIVSSLVNEQRMKRFFFFVAQCLSRELQEHRISTLEQAEVLILEKLFTI